MVHHKKKIAISAINFFEGGPLSVLKDCLITIENSRSFKDFDFVVFVHKKSLFAEISYSKIVFVEFPKSRTAYYYRLFYEYFYFKKVAKELNIDFWFSFHDISPFLGNIPQAVYCHNPSPFNSLNFKDIYLQPSQFFFKLFYKFLYQININSNKYIFVQQLWMKNKFIEMYKLNKDKIIVAPPQISKIPEIYLNVKKNNKAKIFFFPTFPRPFKNIELLCEAVKLVLIQNTNFKVIITIDGSENNYSNLIINKFKNVTNIEFIGLITRDEVYDFFSKVDCLVFPSKLETWGLPVSEFKQFGKPIFIANQPYARETVGYYDLVSFFDVDSPVKLSELMINFLNNKIIYDKSTGVNYDQSFVNGWEELFSIFLNIKIC
jgi:glycosyltransferase involved in cell wall biosynthesis